MSKNKHPVIDAYCLLSFARSYLRNLDDCFVQAGVAYSVTFEHFQVLLAVKTLKQKDVSARSLSEHLIRDRASTIQLCWRMQEQGLLNLTYEPNAAKPQLLISVSEYGEEALSRIVHKGLENRNSYLKRLPAEKRKILARAVRFSWLDGLELDSGF